MQGEGHLHVAFWFEVGVETALWHSFLLGRARLLLGELYLSRMKRRRLVRCKKLVLRGFLSLELIDVLWFDLC